jgi:crotonobetainyl-CoA:carnitine CoA-transferase CaiB-like acyl-CoA transferase
VDRTVTRELAPGPTGPLTGIRVVECASIVLGPMAAQMLADMGADVIKVEPPEGDLTRRIGPRRSEGMGSFFLSNNRNKRSVVLDLKDPGDREVFGTLVDGADVLLHSVRTPAAERLGLGYAELARRNPGLVHCQVTGFADEGPYGGRAAYDDVIQSLSGLAMLQTVVTGVPRYMPAIFADKVTAVHAAFAVAAALVHRGLTGQGQQVVVPMFETMTGFNLQEHIWGHAFGPPIGPMGYEPVSTAARRPFPTLDGFVSMLPYSDSQWRRFFTLIGRDDVMADERFATFAARQQHVPLVWGEIAHQLTLRTNADWMALLEPEDIPFAVVNTLEDLTCDPHLVATDFWQLIEDPVDGVRRLPSPATRMSATPPAVHRLPPRLGEHTAEVLAELGVHRAAARS